MAPTWPALARLLVLAVGYPGLAASRARPVAWSIAGSDSGGGAGLQADLLTFNALGVHGCTAPTALTAQSSVEVRRVEYPSGDMLRATLSTLHDDLPADAIKIGMCGSTDTIVDVAAFLSAQCKGVDVVCDPVMVSSSGTRLLDEEAVTALTKCLFPCCRLVTPNLPEAEALSGRQLRTPAEVEGAAAELLALGCAAVLIKGGHASEAPGGEGVSQDYFTDGETCCWLSSPRLPTSNTHGSGCTLSSAITALLARGLPLLDAVTLAKAYVSQGIAAAEQVGAGPGPVAHTGWPSSSDAMPHISASAEAGAAATSFAPCDEGEMRCVLPIADSAKLIAEIVSHGVRHVQLRMKDKTTEEISAEVAEAQAACAAQGARLWVNDHWRSAVAAGAYGVHVGQEDLEAMGADALDELCRSGLRLGVSTHSYAELAIALGVRPSYISLGPIYETTSKDVSRWDPQGLERIAHWRSLLPPGMPLVAIGGISLERAPGVLEAGADGIAVIGAITKASDRAHAIAQWHAVWS